MMNKELKLYLKNNLSKPSPTFKFSDEDNKKFLNKLHYYTKLPQILEPEKKYSKIDIIKEVVIKIKQTPINELPKKIIKKLKKG